MMNIKRKISDDEFDRWQCSPDGYCVMETYKNNKLIVLDGRLDNFNGTKYINDSKGRSKGNLGLTSSGGFYPIKNIKEGDELLFQYSPRNTYWKNRSEKKIFFGSNTKGISIAEKEELAKNKKLKSFPDIPVSITTYKSSYKKRRFVKAMWKDGKDKDFNQMYNGHILENNKEERRCTILFEDKTCCSAKYCNITLVKKTCPYCDSKDFMYKDKYDNHVKNCRIKFLKSF